MVFKKNLAKFCRFPNTIQHPIISFEMTNKLFEITQQLRIQMNLKRVRKWSRKADELKHGRRDFSSEVDFL